MKKIIPAAVLALILTAPAWAAPRTVTLAVPGMTCGACPITVRTALDRVPGVEHVAVAVAKRQVTVTFDDARTTAAALTRATRDAGYPSTVTATASTKRSR